MGFVTNVSVTRMIPVERMIVPQDATDLPGVWQQLGRGREDRKNDEKEAERNNGEPQRTATQVQANQPPPVARAQMPLATPARRMGSETDAYEATAERKESSARQFLRQLERGMQREAHDEAQHHAAAGGRRSVALAPTVDSNTEVVLEEESLWSRIWRGR